MYKLTVITQRIYEEIKQDIPKIDGQMKTREGSGDLWRSLRTKYSVLLPGLLAHIRESGKIGTIGLEFDYRPELSQLKEAILAYLIKNPLEEQSNKSISNDAKNLINEKISSYQDNRINVLITESKIYMRSGNSSDKQNGLERIWDAFERLKTIYDSNNNKKIASEKILNKVSQGSKLNKEMLSKEFRELTKIGNSYQIRHFETDKEEIHSDEFKEYLYFRALSLISYCIKQAELS